MATVTMPQLGESVTEGTVLKWLKQPGEAVRLDESLCEIETEKVTAELPSPFAGTMGAILVREGETVEVGVPLCELIENGATDAPNAHGPVQWSGGPMAIPPAESPAAADEPVSAPAPPEAPERSGAVRDPGPVDRRRFFSPIASRLAAAHDIDLGSLTGSGIDGRVTKQDVEAAIGRLEPTPPGGPPARPPRTGDRPTASPYAVVELSATRRTIGARLTRSNLEAPQAWTMVEADVSLLERRRFEDRGRLDPTGRSHLTLFPYFALAVCQALREFPEFNSRWEDGELRRYLAVNAGIAVGTDRGLVVPVVRDAQNLNAKGLASALDALVGRARSGRLQLEDVEEGTITLNNTGAFGSIASRPLLNYPQVAIVTLERVVLRPVVIAGGIAIRSIVNVCLSFDHRVADGLEAGGFLAAIKRELEGEHVTS